MKFMITKKSSGPVTNCSQTFKDQEEVNSMTKKEEPRASRKLVLHTQRTIPTNERKWKVIHAHSSDDDTWQLQYLRWLHERQTDGSRQWDTIMPVLLRAFAQESARDFDEFWLHLIHMKAVTRKNSNIARIKMDLHVIHELFKDTLVAFQQVQNL